MSGSLLVVGTGLIGTSIGLAASAAGETVWLTDLDDGSVELAEARGAGRRWDGNRSVDLVVLCAPPTAIASALIGLQRLGVSHNFTHVSSVQSQVQSEVESLSSDPTSIVGGHPLAGREVSGPGAARQELFRDRPWAICPPATVGPRTGEVVAAVRRLAMLCGATPVEMTARAHDDAVALGSHLPQVASSALAAVLTSYGPPAMSGPGLVDTTRLAGGDAGLWTEILVRNARPLAPVVAELADVLTRLAADLADLPDWAGRDEPATAVGTGAVRSFLERGRDGHALVPGKHGGGAAAFARVSVVLQDTPGQLAAVLAVAAQTGANVEDLRVEHLPSRPAGVLELQVVLGGVRPLVEALRAAGWDVDAPEA